MAFPWQPREQAFKDEAMKNPISYSPEINGNSNGGASGRGVSPRPDMVSRLGAATFDRLARLAGRLLHVPITFVFLADRSRCFFKNEAAFPDSWQAQIQVILENSLCHRVLQTGRSVILENTQEEYNGFPALAGHGIGAFVGLPLTASDGRILGAFCALDFTPRAWPGEDLALLHELTDTAIAEIEMRLLLGRVQQQAEATERFVFRVFDALPASITILDEKGTILATNQTGRQWAQADAGEILGIGQNYLAICDQATGPHAAEARAFAEGIRAVLRGERDFFEMEYPHHAANQRRWFLGRVTRFGRQKTVRLVIAQEDITRRKLAEEELAKVSRLLKKAQGKEIAN
jgi:PAS domain-containing protein